MKFNWTKPAEIFRKNYEGVKSYQITPEMELYTAAVTSLLENASYESTNQRLSRIKALVTKVKPEFCAKLAVYIRQNMHLRSIPVVLSVELAKNASGHSFVKSMIEKIVQRPDEIVEMLAYYQISNERTGTKRLNRLSKQVQKGLALAFNKFDEYQFAKYNHRTGVIKLRDALFLVHPKPKNQEQQTIFDKIIQNTLATPYTWETELSALGQESFVSSIAKKKAFKTQWEALIVSDKLGYMALLRNLRNIIESEVSDSHLTRVSELLTNHKAVANSKQLPFRFLAAYRELSTITDGRVSSILNALEKAIVLSTINLQGFDKNTKVVIACDVSGSMQKAISPKSSIMYYDIGLVLGMLLQSKCENVITGMFGDIWKLIALPNNQILENVTNFYQREGEVGYATNGHLVIQDLINRKYQADKVFLFTDTQMWDNQNAGDNTFEDVWKKYKKIAPQAKLYLFDLAGYGQMPIQIQERDVYLIAGWSDKIFDVLSAIDSGQNSLAQIEAIKL